MIVPSMNVEEIRKEIKKKFPIVFRKANYVAIELGKTLKPKREEKIIRYFDYLSKYKNSWIYKVILTRQRDYYVFLHYNYDKQGLNAIAVMGDLDDYMFLFTAHCFKRYKERRNLNLVNPTDILRSFMDDNSSFQVQRMGAIGEDFHEIFCTTN